MHRSYGNHRAVGILVALLMGSVAIPAAAQSDVPEPTPEQVRLAAEAFDLGRQAYKDGRFTEAAEQFERADASAPSAAALALAIRSRDKSGDLDRAGTLASLALTRYPDDEDIAQIAPDVIARAGAALYELTVTCSEPCDLTDGTKVVHGRRATRRTLFLTAGTHELRAGFDGDRTASHSVDALEGASGSVDFAPPSPAVEQPVETPPPPAPEPPAAKPEADEGVRKRHGLPPIVFWAGAGATAVAGGLTLWSGVDTVNNPGVAKVKALCAAGDEDCKYYKEGRSKQTRTNILLGVTGVLGVATGVVAAIAIDWGPRPAPNVDEGKRNVHFSPYFAWSNGPSVGARGSF